MAEPSFELQKDEARKRLHAAVSDLNYILERFGDHLAQKEGYDGIDGMEAVWLYLIRTHHWTPSYVKSLNPEELRFALNVEMKGFTASPITTTEPTGEESGVGGRRKGAKKR